MPDDTATPKFSRAQHDKIGPCPSCGVPTPYRTSRALCEACRIARRRAGFRKFATTQRRKRGIAQVKDTEGRCDNCGTTIIRRTHNHRLCDACWPDEERTYARRRVNRISRERGAPQYGETHSCANCGADFVYQQAMSIYCAPCVKLQAKGKLPKQREYRSEWHRERIQTDPAFALNNRMRRALNHSLGDSKAGRSWESLVGYTVHDLKRHLERMFLPGMSWENVRLWQIDHITPLALFHFASAEDPEFKAAWALWNLRPLWKPDNYAKRAHRLFLI